MCSKCKEPKPIGEFYFRNKSKGTRQHHCIPCFKVFRDAHYQNNKATYKKRCKIRSDRMEQEVDGNIFAYLTKHPCVDCGEKDIVVLDFDHNEPAKKTLSIAVMRRRKFPWNKISIEISKCSVRCSNCHRRRTAKQFNWYKQR